MIDKNPLLNIDMIAARWYKDQQQLFGKNIVNCFLIKTFNYFAHSSCWMNIFSFNEVKHVLKTSCKSNYIFLKWMMNITICFAMLFNSILKNAISTTGRNNSNQDIKTIIQESTNSHNLNLLINYVNFSLLSFSFLFNEKINCYREK